MNIPETEIDEAMCGKSWSGSKMCDLRNESGAGSYVAVERIVIELYNQKIEKAKYIEGWFIHKKAEWVNDWILILSDSWSSVVDI